MCEFCENIAKSDKECSELIADSKDFIFVDGNGYSIFIDTGDSGCPGVLSNIKFCPICGRKLR